MGYPPRKDPKRSVEAHVYMTPTMHRRLKHEAEFAHRSLTAQILYFVQKGLEREKLGVEIDANGKIVP